MFSLCQGLIKGPGLGKIDLVKPHSSFACQLPAPTQVQGAFFLGFVMHFGNGKSI